MADETGKAEEKAGKGKKDKKEKLSKAEKKELKKKRKEAIKEAKKNGTYNPEDFEDDDSGGGLGMVIFSIFFILLIWAGIFSILVKMDVGGLGSSIMYPIIKDIPVVNYILPEMPDEPVKDSYTFETMDEAIARIKELEQQLSKATSTGSETDSKIAELEAQVAALQPYKDSVDQFNAERKKYYEEVVFSDKAPDIKEYSTYYESINPTNAEIIYREVVEQLQDTQEISDYAAAYSSMDASKAAGIFDNMTGNFKLVARILKAMTAQQRADILANMDKTNAAAITEMMEPKKK